MLPSGRLARLITGGCLTLSLAFSGCGGDKNTSGGGASSSAQSDVVAPAQPGFFLSTKQETFPSAACVLSNGEASYNVATLVRCETETSQYAHYRQQTASFTHSGDVRKFIDNALNECQTELSLDALENQKISEFSSTLYRIYKNSKLKLRRNKAHGQKNKAESAALAVSVDSFKEFSQACVVPSILDGKYERKTKRVKKRRSKNEKKSVEAEEKSTVDSVPLATPVEDAVEPSVDESTSPDEMDSPTQFSSSQDYESVFVPTKYSDGSDALASSIKQAIVRMKDRGALNFDLRALDRDIDRKCLSASFLAPTYVDACTKAAKEKARAELDVEVLQFIKAWLSPYVRVTKNTKSLSEFDENNGGLIIKYYKKEYREDFPQTGVAIVTALPDSDMIHRARYLKPLDKKFTFKSFFSFTEALRKTTGQFGIELAAEIESEDLENLSLIVLKTQFGHPNMIFLSHDARHGRRAESVLVHELRHMMDYQKRVSSGRAASEAKVDEWLQKSNASSNGGITGSHERVTQSEAYRQFLKAVSTEVLKSHPAMLNDEAKTFAENSYVEIFEKMIAVMPRFIRDGEMGFVEEFRMTRQLYSSDVEKSARSGMRLDSSRYYVELPDGRRMDVEFPIPDVILDYWKALYDRAI